MDNEKNRIRLSDISIVCLVREVIRHLWMVIAVALVFAMGTSLFLGVLRPPVYTASMTYAVTAKRSAYYTDVNLTAAKEVAAVLTELIRSDVIAGEIRKTSDELAGFDGSLTAVQMAESNFINVNSTSKSPEAAFRSLVALIDVFPSLSDYVSDSSVVQVIRNPSVSSVPSNSVNERRLCMTAALIGAVLTVVLICYISVVRECVQTREGARHLLDAPVIGMIGHERKYRTFKSALKHPNTGLQVFAPTTSFAYTEQISSICSQLEHERIANGRKIFLITGVGENEGKSTVAANIAASLAQKGKNVALIDADLRRPSLNLFFEQTYTSEIPLNKLLAHPLTKESVFKCIQRHDRLGLYMLFAYETDERCTELITGRNMDVLLNKLRVMEYIIIDTPPMGMFPDAEALAQRADASLLVVRQNVTPACDINDAIDALRSEKAEFLGCILNDMRSSPSLGGRAYGYGYGYGYGKKYGYEKNRKKSGRD